MSVAVCRDIDLSGMSAGSVPAQGSKGTIHRRPSDGSKYDGDHGYGNYIDSGTVSAGRLSGRYLSDLCYDQFSGSGGTDKGIYRGVSGTKGTEAGRSFRRKGGEGTWASA